VIHGAEAQSEPGLFHSRAQRQASSGLGLAASMNKSPQLHSVTAFQYDQAPPVYRELSCEKPSDSTRDRSIPMIAAAVMHAGVEAQLTSFEAVAALPARGGRAARPLRGDPPSAISRSQKPRRRARGMKRIPLIGKQRSI
jgi:hypothetical protein